VHGVSVISGEFQVLVETRGAVCHSPVLHILFSKYVSCHFSLSLSSIYMPVPCYVLVVLLYWGRLLGKSINFCLSLT
jgi:hypothetical protein